MFYLSGSEIGEDIVIDMRMHFDNSTSVNMSLIDASDAVIAGIIICKI